MNDRTDAEVRAYTVRLELVDEPGELLRALEPIAENGGNLLSIFHERGNLTPRGHIPVEIDLEATPERFEIIVDALREAGVNVIQAGPERFSEEITVIFVGHLIDTDLSDTFQRFNNYDRASITDISLSAPGGADDVSSARVRIVVQKGEIDSTLAVARNVAEEKDLNLIEPLTPGGEV
ncbi:MAG: amino acid-binding protein [Halobacteriaceae archaeon]